MPDRFRVSSLLREKLVELSLSPEAVLRQADLPLGLFDLDRILLSTEELFALYEAIGEVSRDPVVGLKIGAEDRLERYCPIAIAALCARSFRDALARVARYKQLTCPEELVVISKGGECEVRFTWMLTHQTEPPLVTDVCFAWLVAIGRRGVGRPVTPIRVEFKRKPAHREVYETHFGCPVRFEVKHNALVFDAADLDRPFVTYNPDLLAMIAPRLEQELARRTSRRSIREQVNATLKQLLAGRRPGIKDVARELRTSVRTLQRRLTEEGASYQGALEEARSELAQHYLLHSRRDLDEIAYLLGYEDANSFIRAFQHWEGLPPGRWRDDRQRRRGRPQDLRRPAG
jgi:AraC-like DNA-binding protein